MIQGLGTSLPSPYTSGTSRSNSVQKTKSDQFLTPSEREELFAYLFDRYRGDPENKKYDFSETKYYEIPIIMEYTGPILVTAPPQEAPSGKTQKDGNSFASHLSRQYTLGGEGSEDFKVIKSIGFTLDTAFGRMGFFMDKLRNEDPNWQLSMSGSFNLHTVQTEMEKASELLQNHLSQYGIDYPVEIVANKETGRIEVRGIEENTLYQRTALEYSLNQDSDLKTLLFAASRSLAVADGKADQFFYSAFDQYLEKYFGQSLSELEGKPLSSYSSPLREMLSCTSEEEWEQISEKTGIPSFWSEEYQDDRAVFQHYGIVVPFNSADHLAFQSIFTSLLQSGEPSETFTASFLMEDGKLLSQGLEISEQFNSMAQGPWDNLEFLKKFYGAGNDTQYHYIQKMRGR